MTEREMIDAIRERLENTMENAYNRAKASGYNETALRIARALAAFNAPTDIDIFRDEVIEKEINDFIQKGGTDVSEDKAKYGEKEAELNPCPYCGKSDVKYTKSQMNVDYGTCKNCKRTIYKISVNGFSALGGWEEKEVIKEAGGEKTEIVKLNCPECGSDRVTWVATDDVEYFCGDCGARFGQDRVVKETAWDKTKEKTIQEAKTDVRIAIWKAFRLCDTQNVLQMHECLYGILGEEFEKRKVES